MCAIDLRNSGLLESVSRTELRSIPPSVGGSASPFIDEGDGFIGEREIVRMFLSLAAHGDENWIMVDTPQYFRCRCRISDMHGRSSYLLQEG